MFLPRFLTRNQRLKCSCGGYWFPHRRGGGACDHSKTRDIHLAIRYARATDDWEPVLDAMVDFAFDNPGRRGNVCPF